MAQGVLAIAVAHFPGRPQAHAPGRPLRAAEEGAAKIGPQLRARHTRRLYDSPTGVSRVMSFLISSRFQRRFYVPKFVVAKRKTKK
jgi:hypothetical protein